MGTSVWCPWQASSSIRGSLPNFEAVWPSCLLSPTLDILLAVHDVFHVSQLKKCLRIPNEAVEIEGLPLQPDLTYIEHPVKILDEKERVTRNNVVKFYKVQWQNHSEDEATWEQESYILEHYPHLLSCSSRQLFISKCIPQLFSHTRHMKSWDEILFQGGRFITPSVLHCAISC